MATGLIDIYNLANSSEFRNKVRSAMIKAALNIVGESNYNEKRHNLGVEILNNVDAKVQSFAYAVAANPVITGSSSDGDLEFTVNSVYNDIAGIKITEAQV